MGKKSKRKAVDTVDQTTNSPKKAKLENSVSEQRTPRVRKPPNQGPTNYKATTNIVGPNSNKENKKKTSQQNSGETNSGKKGKKAGNKKNKNAPKVENASKSKSQQSSNKNVGNSRTGEQDIIPEDLAKNLSKKRRQAVSKKVRTLIKIREAGGEKINKEEIIKLVKEIIQQKTSSNNEDKTEVIAKETADKIDMPTPTKKQKKGNKKPNIKN